MERSQGRPYRSVDHILRITAQIRLYSFHYCLESTKIINFQKPILSNLDVVYHEQPLVKAHTDEMIECVQSKQKGISAELSTPLQKLQVDFSCLNRMTI